ncbi:MAG: site-specific DNA-methyltransferase, partial [Bacteroidota bacterium]|nr:site-specific DNA-methyltransferase [Bacteroidota bacterium]
MEKIDKGHPMSQSIDFVAQNIETLKTLFPTIVKEGKIDIKELQALLGDEIETEEEYYRFTWAGKSIARREANKPSTATLRPDKESSKDWDNTKNIFIEGDNLEVLKLLQKSYANKIKIVNIDPPYNTGNVFVYKDNYNDNLGNYLAITGQLNDEGKRISTNSESDGRYHSNWLNMMYPRLKLARNLMTDDGVIFILIDDNEASNLKKICDEVFGEENFLGQTVRVSNSAKNNVNQISITHEYAIVYCKQIDKLSKEWSVPKNNVDEFVKRANRLMKNNLKKEEIEKELKELIKYPRFYDFDHYYYCDNKGVYRTDNPGGVPNGNIDTDIIHPITNKKCKKPNGGWRYKESTIKEMLENEMFHFGLDENTIPSPKRYLNDYLTQKPMGVHFFDSQMDTKNQEIPFDFPKPVDYIKYLLRMEGSNDCYILDFFAGSGTTAHATIQLNTEDGGSRKFICVQLPEPTDEKSEAFKAGYKAISEITKERIRR